MSSGEGAKPEATQGASGQIGVSGEPMPVQRQGSLRQPAEGGGGGGGKRAYGAFMALMFLIAGCCIFLFAWALLREQPLCPSEFYLSTLPMLERWLLVGIVTLISLVPLALLFRQLFYRDHQGEGTTEILLHLSVHAVPYGILSLSMLFEYHKIIKGDAEGAAALASIMILFILSELGLILFTEVREAKKASRDLSKALADVHGTEEKLREDLASLPWLKEHAEIASTASSDFVKEIGTLLNEWKRLLAPPVDLRHLLLNLFLCQYLREEVKDISGDVNSTRLPEGIKLPGLSHYHRVSIFATNIDFYACFLEQAVEKLSIKIGGRLNPDHRACIVAVTTALPTQFWNWPKDEGRKTVYKPVSDYREAQFKAVEAGLTKIFRTVLIADSAADKKDAEEAEKANVAPNAGEVAAETSEELSVLRLESEWQAERDWLFILNKEKPLTRRDMRFPFDLRFLAPSLEWTRGTMVNDSSPDAAYWMAKKELKKWLEDEKKKGDDPDKKDTFGLVSVWEFYCRNMHGPDLSTGRTEVIPVSKIVFNEEWGKGFAGCRDLILLGTCTSKEDDVWEDKGVEWGIALMTSMSTRTETMFLVVMHESQYIQEIWLDLSNARKRLGKDKTLSDSRLSNGREGA